MSTDNARTAQELADATVGDVVWFRPGRMHGYPPQPALRAMVTRVRADGRVDLEIGCDGMSQISGVANAVAHIDSLPDALKEQQACWWNGGGSDHG